MSGSGYRPASLLAGFWAKASGSFSDGRFPGREYWSFFRAHYGILSYTLLFTFYSSLGQTFLLSLFQPSWLRAFDLTPGEIGRYYGIATVLGGFLLPWVGRKLDTVPMRMFSFWSTICLGSFAMLMAIAWSPWVFFVALLGLRFFGQGIAPNVSFTLAARSFAKDRGKAVGVTGLGFPLGEGFFPLVLTALMAYIGWRLSWGILSLSVFVIMLPLGAKLLKVETKAKPDGLRPDEMGNPLPRSVILRDWRFFGVVGAMLPLPFLGTGIIFYQTLLAESRGWPLAVFAIGFTVFAIIRALFSLIVGSWIDQWSARKMLTLQMAIFTLAIGSLLLPGLWGAYLFFVILGVSFGLSSSVMSAVWAEVYGPENIGTIRGMTSAIGVFSTALAPVSFGLALDAGISLQRLILVSFVALLLVFLPLTAVTSHALCKSAKQ